MILYKAVKNGVADYIKKEEALEKYEAGCTIIKEENNIDLIRMEPNENIPAGFFVD